MNKELTRYRRALKKHLHCGVSTRRQLLDRFDNSLSDFLADCPTPTQEQLKSAFGPPEEAAGVLMETVSENEQIRCQKRKTLLRILASAVAVLFIVFTIYVYFVKDIVLISSDVVIPDETGISQGVD